MKETLNLLAVAHGFKGSVLTEADLVKGESREREDGSDFCIIGEGSEVFREYEEAGLVYLQGDREILVKGKNPKSWMVLQLSKEDGYYSIITAFPIENLNKKPSGKRIPLVEHTLRSNPKPQGKPVSLPTSSATGQSAFGTGTDNQAVSVGATAGGGSGVSLPAGVKVVNINDVELQFDDGGVMAANWSLETGSDFCIIGEGSEVFREYEEAGLVYVDKADGKKKAVLDNRGVKLKQGLGSVEILTMLKEGDKNVLVAIAVGVNARGRKGVVNRITSLYGKSKIGELLKHKALYWNKRKARYALSDYRLQLPATALVMRASGKNVPDKVDLVKYKEENGFNFGSVSDLLGGEDYLSGQF